MSQITLPKNDIVYQNFYKGSKTPLPVVYPSISKKTLTAVREVLSKLPIVLLPLIEGYISHERITYLSASPCWKKSKPAEGFSTVMFNSIETIYALIVAPYPTAEETQHREIGELIDSQYPPNHFPKISDGRYLKPGVWLSSHWHHFPGQISNPGGNVTSVSSSYRNDAKSTKFEAHADRSKRYLYDLVFLPQHIYAYHYEGNSGARWDFDVNRAERLCVQVIRSDNPNSTTVETTVAEVEANPQKFQQLLVQSFREFGVDLETDTGEIVCPKSAPAPALPPAPQPRNKCKRCTIM